MTVEEWLDGYQLGIDIWHKKYQFEDETFDEWLNRVSGNDEEVKDLILNKKFLFGGRILANRGIQDKVKCTFSNCYVLGVEDSIESIYKTCSDLARTYSMGGGVGIDVTNLRPRGCKVNNSAKTTTGAVSFMPVFNNVTETICQMGRRGALMISMDIRHPDIMEFIDCKANTDKITSANISVRVTNEFMEAVEGDKDFTLQWPIDSNEPIVKKIVKAKELFHKLCVNNWNYAEPGILYWDEISNFNMLSEDPNFEYAGVNPCAEEPLPIGGSCLLGSINLSEFVIKDDLDVRLFDYEEFSKTVTICVRALNDVLLEGMPLHPLEVQRQAVNDYRQIGLGIFGLADLLIKLRIKYGSVECITLLDEIGLRMADAAIHASMDLAKLDKYGTYPKFTDEIFNSPYFESLINARDAIRDGVTLANSQLLTVAPTGTISTMLNVSGGIEPIFANEYTRTTKSLHGEDVTYKVHPKIVEDYLQEHNITDIKRLPDYFVTASDLDYHDRIAVQSTFGSWIDASISSTINLKESTTVEDVEDLYLTAWKQGLKGVTIFRDGCKRTAILNTKETKEPKEVKKKFDSITPVSRKKMGTTYGCTMCKKCACGTLYVTVNTDKDANLVELFTHTSKGGICQANLNAVTRMISLNLRSGVKVDEIIDQLKGIHCPACQMKKAKGERVDGISCPDIISKTLEHVYKDKEVIEPEVSQVCPECGAKLSFTGGCCICSSCGYSKCN